MRYDTTTANTPDDQERLARKRAGSKMGFFIHAFVYLAVNTALVTISMSSGHRWAAFPLLGWGLGLLIHGLVVFVTNPGGSLYSRLLDHERKVLGQRDTA